MRMVYMEYSPEAEQALQDLDFTWRQGTQRHEIECVYIRVHLLRGYYVFVPQAVPHKTVGLEHLHSLVLFDGDQTMIYAYVEGINGPTVRNQHTRSN